MWRKETNAAQSLMTYCIISGWSSSVSLVYGSSWRFVCTVFVAKYDVASPYIGGGGGRRIIDKLFSFPANEFWDCRREFLQRGSWKSGAQAENDLDSFCVGYKVNIYKVPKDRIIVWRVILILRQIRQSRLQVHRRICMKQRIVSYSRGSSPFICIISNVASPAENIVWGWDLWVRASTSLI